MQSLRVDWLKIKNQQNILQNTQLIKKNGYMLYYVNSSLTVKPELMCFIRAVWEWYDQNTAVIRFTKIAELNPPTPPSVPPTLKTSECSINTFLHLWRGWGWKLNKPNFIGPLCYLNTFQLLSIITLKSIFFLWNTYHQLKYILCNFVLYLV